jgi:hypothetical protein
MRNRELEVPNKIEDIRVLFQLFISFIYRDFLNSIYPLIEFCFIILFFKFEELFFIFSYYSKIITIYKLSKELRK